MAFAQETTKGIAHTHLAFSNFLPLDLTYGLVWDPGTPGAGPKCFLASLSLEALSKRVLVPIINQLINQKLKHYNKEFNFWKKNRRRYLTSWSCHDQLVEGEALSTSFDDSSSSGLSESESSNSHFWYIKKSIVISYFANNNGDFVPTIENSKNLVRGTYCPFKSWETLEIEIGGLLILEDTSLLKTVLLKEESVLLDKNLNS